jgi:hypothetical protein
MRVGVMRILQTGCSSAWGHKLCFLLMAECVHPQAFINLQAFVATLLPALGPAAFRPWAYTFTLRMVAASGRLPQLSGFYHLITTAMQLADAAGLIDSQQACFGTSYSCAFPATMQHLSSTVD